MIYGEVSRSRYSFNCDIVPEGMIKDMDVLKLLKFAHKDILAAGFGRSSHYEIECRFRQPEEPLRAKDFETLIESRAFWLSLRSGIVQGFGFSCNFFEKNMLLLCGERVKRALEIRKLELANIIIFSPEFANAQKN